MPYVNSSITHMEPGQPNRSGERAEVIMNEALLAGLLRPGRRGKLETQEILSAQLAQLVTLFTMSRKKKIRFVNPSVASSLAIFAADVCYNTWMLGDR